MTHLYIELNTGLTEEVNSSIISKLYELAISGDLDETSDLKGRLHSSVARDTHVSYLTTHYPLLYITADTTYITFADQEVEKRLATKFGDGVGVTNIDMAGVASINSGTGFDGNTDVTLFPELKNFTNLINLNTFSFSRTTNLTTIDLTNIQHIGGEAFISSGITGVIDLPNIVSIGDGTRSSSFSLCTNITKVNIGSNFNNDTRYMGSVFSGCTNLQEVTGLSGITSIPSYMFNGCGNLSSVDIDFSKITSIGSYAFNDCINLQATMNSTIGIIGGQQFNKCSNITFPSLITISASVPESNQDKNFLTKSFRQTDLSNTDVILDSSIKVVGEYAFSESHLKSISANYVKIFSGYSFYGCDAEEIILPLAESLVQSYDRTNHGVFSNNTNLKKVVLGHLTTFPSPTLHDYNRGWFTNCSALKYLDIGDSVTSIAVNKLGGMFTKSTVGLQTFIIRNTTVPLIVSDNGNDSLLSEYTAQQLISCFGGSNVKIYVPDSALNDYKTANMWQLISSYIYPLSDIEPNS